MSDAPAFFIPVAPPERYEEFYVQMARACNVPVPEMAQRIYSISWVHDSTDLWRGTVAESLTGTRTVSKGRGRSKTQYTLPIDDPARVLAIFPGRCYVVYTDSGAGKRTIWANPLGAGIPTGVEYFSTGEVPK
jgi:hypothetical protein